MRRAPVHAPWVRRVLARLVAAWCRRGAPSSAPVVEALEPRMLLSADLGLGLDAPRHLTDPDDTGNANDGALDALPGPVTDPPPATNDADDETPQPLALDAIDALVGERTETHAERRHEVVFVDAAVEDADTLLAALQERSDATLSVIILDAERDGIAQISDTLGALDDVDAVHVLSHGNELGLQLGSTWLDDDSLQTHARDIAGWGLALSDGADLLLYGCNLAEGADGRALLQDVARLTGADVGASVDATGAATLGGDWDLEYRIGTLETALTVEAPDAWQHVLALIAEESFDYAAATSGLNGQSGGTGWANAWSNIGNDTTTVASSLSDPTGTLATSGGALQFTTDLFGGVEQSRDLSTTLGTSGTTVWASFLLETEHLSSNAYTGVGFGNSGVFVGFDDYEFKIMNRGGGGEAGSGITPVIDDTVLVVAKFDFAAGNDTVSMYLDPTPGETSPDTAPIAVKSDRDLGTFTTIELVGGLGSNNSILDEIRIGDTYADVVPTVSTDGLLLSTVDDVTSGGAPGDDTWHDEDVINVSGTDFSLGPDSDTDGSFSLEFDLAAFGTNKDLKALHYIQSSFTVGSGLASDVFTFEPGDLLISPRGSGDFTYTGNTTSITVQESDVFVFRPQAAGDYSGGDFYYLLDDPVGQKIRSIAIVESLGGVTIGDGPALSQGTFLLSHDGAGESPKVYTYLADTVGDGPGQTTSVLGKQVLIDGDDTGNLNLTDQVQGIHLIEADSIIGGMSFQAGDLLLTLNDDALTIDGAGIGATSQDVYQHDVFRLRLTETAQGSGRSMGVADIVFDGSSVGLDSDQEDLDAFTLVGGELDTNVAPTLTTFGSTVASTMQDTEVEVSFEALIAQGDEADSDGTVEAFVVESVTSGSLRIGTSEATATAWIAGSNDVIDATRRAYWTPDLAVTGTLDAFEAVARDDGGKDSTTLGVVATVDVSSGASRLVVDTTSDDLDGDVSSIDALLADKGADGFISLREAITAANNTGNVGGPDEIHFDIAGTGPHVISPDSALPWITDAVVIDGTSEPDHGATLAVQIDGGSAGTVDGLELRAGSDGSTIRGLSITGFDSGGGEGNAITIRSDFNTITGNFIGVAADGSTTGANTTGIDVLLGASDNTIGGTDAADRNVLTANTYAGVAIHGNATDDNEVIGNYIGLNAAGDTVIGNGAFGVVLWDLADGTKIGGTVSGEANVIAGNQDGVLIDNTAIHTTVRGNAIYDNTGLGIDLNNDEVTANDSDGTDNDAGPNDLQNFPVLSTATVNGGDLTVVGSLRSDAGIVFQIDFYASASGDASGHGEAERYLGSTSVTTNGSGLATFNVDLLGVGVTTGEVITATATSASGNTSEFAENVVAAGPVSLPDEGLWLSTRGDVTGGGQPAGGIDTWDRGDVITIGDPDLDLGVTTNGSFSNAFDLELFNTGADVNAIHFVGRDIQLGSSGFQLKEGDLLLVQGSSASRTFSSTSTAVDTGFSSSITVEDDDVFVFRPDTIGDYSAGTFAMLLENVSTGDRIRAVTLVEQDTTVGDVTVQAGDFLLAGDGAFGDNDIWLYDVTDVGAGSTSGSLSKLIEGADPAISIGNISPTTITGIDLVENATTIGGESLSSGTLLVSISLAESVGSPLEPVEQFDVIALDVSTTTLGAGAGNASAVATRLFDGSDVGFNDDPNERLDALTLTSTNPEPTIVDITVPGAQSTDEDTDLTFSAAGGNAITISDGTGADATLRVTLSVDNGVLTLATTAGLTFESGADGTASMTISGTESELNAALDGLVFTPTGDYSGPANLDVTTDGADLTTGLEGAFSFDDAGDLGNNDAPGGTPDATNNGVASFNDGTRGLVGEFTRIEDDHMQITGRFGDPSSATLAAWVNLEAGYRNADVITIGDDLALRLDDTGSSGGVMGFFYDGSTWQRTMSLTEINGTGWHHVAYTFDEVLGQQTLYIDGVAVATTSHAGAITYAHSPDTVIGSHVSGSSYEMQGMIDDARIYTRALSAAEIEELAGGAADSESVAITVNPINDDPVNDGTLPATATVKEDTLTDVNLSEIDLSDVDAGASDLKLILSSGGGGTITATGAGVTITGSGTDSVEVQGTLAELNAFLDAASSVQYLNDAGTTADTINVSINDLGNTGTGGGSDVLLGSVTVDVTPVGDTPIANDITTDEDTLSGLIVLDRNADDGPEVTHLKITGITNGTLFLADGVTPVSNGAFITVAQGNAGLRFLPFSNSTATGSFDVEASEDGATVAEQSAKATSTITVNPVGDTPVVNDITTDEDTLSGLIVLDRNASDGPEVTHLRISGISNGTLFLADGVTPVSNGDFVTVVQGNAGLRFMPIPGSSATGSFDVESSEDGATVAAQSAKATSTITVTPVGDTPIANDITTDEDTLSGLIVLDRNAGDGPEVTHFKITGITNGALFLADGVTPVSNGDFITVAQGQAGLRFMPTPGSSASGSFDVESSEDGATVAAQSAKATSTITVTPVGDTPIANDITTDEDTLSGLIVLDRNASDGPEVTHLKITGITNGTLFLADGVTPVSNGDFITVAQGQAGLRFMPTPGSSASGSFDVEASEDGATVADQSAKATSTITVTPVGDTPIANDITTDEDTLSGLIVLDRNASDGPEVTHLKITGISNGTLFLADGVTPISNGDFITVAQGQAGLRFMPTPGSSASGSFDVESSEDGATVAAQSAKATSTITVTPIGDTPIANDITTDEDTLSGLIVLDRNAGDGAEVTHLKITGITNGTLFLADGVTPVSNGDFITVAQGQAGLRFMPASNSTAPGSFDVESSEDGATVAAQSAKATSTITVTPVGDTPIAGSTTTTEDTLSGLIVLDRNAGDGPEVTHLKITGIMNGTLFLADGVTPVSDGDFITVAQGNAGLRFMPSPSSTLPGSFDVESSEDGATVAAQSAKATATITVNPAGDTPTVGDATTDEDTLSGPIVVDRHPSDGPEVTHFKITGITNGSLFLADGVTPVSNGDFVLVADGQAGLRFIPDPDSVLPGSFDAESSEDGATVSIGSGKATSTITVTPVGDTPVANDITVDEDTLSGLIVLDRNASDGAEVTHLKITGISNGTLFLADGVTPVSNGDFITVAEGAAGLRFLPTPGSSASGSFDVESSEDGASVAAQSAKATSTITVTPVGDTPVANDITTDEDTLSGLIVLDRNAGDGAEVTHLKITGITNGTLFLADGITPVSEGDFITVAQGNVGLRFMPTPGSSASGSFHVESSEDGATVAAQSAKATSTITVTAVGDTPVAASITTDEDTLSGLIVLDRNAGDGAEVTHLKITGISNGTLLLADGVTPVNDGDFITFAQGNAGLRFLPTPGSSASGSFDVESSEDGATVAAQSAKATSTITVNPVGDTPVANDITTDEDTLSGLIVLDRNAGDGPEVTHLKITGITNGTLFLADGVTPISNGDFITVAQGNAGLRFLPSPGSNAAGSFDVEASEDGATVAEQSGKATSTITVTPVGDTPVANDITTDEDTLSGLIALDRNAGDGPEVTHLKITGISNGTLFLADGVTPVSDGDFITVAEGAAGLRFMPTPGSSASGSFDVESSEDGASVAAQSAKATSTIIVNPVGDTPVANDITTDEDTVSGLIVLDRNAGDGPEVTHLKITGITNGTLFLADGVTPISNGDFITVAEGAAGLRFLPTPGSSASGSFDVESSEDGATVAAQSAKATSTITVNAVGDTPVAASITTDEDTLSGLIVLDRNAGDGAEVTHLKITGISNGTLFLTDGVTPVSNGDFITVAQGNSGLRFLPAPNSTGPGSFDVESSEDGTTVAAQSAKATSTITVNPVGDTPVANDITTDEDTVSGLIVLDRNASDGPEVTHLKITGISNGTLFLADGVTAVSNGDFITVAQGNAGLRFMPSPSSTLPGSFDVESSEDGTTVAAQSAKATSTVSVTPSGTPSDPPVVEVVVEEEETPAPEEDVVEAKEDETVEALEPAASPESPAETRDDVATEDVEAAPEPPVDAIDEAAPLPSSVEVETPAPSIDEPTFELAQPTDDDRAPDEARPVGFVDRMLLALTQELPSLSLDAMLENYRVTNDGGSVERPDLSFFNRDSAFLGELDAVRQDMAGTKVFDVTTVGSTVVVSTGLSVGYVVWLARGGVLLASLLSSMPAWRIVDPLPILARVKDDELVDGGDSLASLIDAGIARGAGPGTPLRSIRVNGMELPAPIDSLPSYGTSDT